MICALVTWLLFYFLRTVIYDYPFSVPSGFYLGLLLYTLGWLSLHLLSGAYDGLYQKTSVTEFLRTFLVSVIGCLVLLFFFILKNPQEDNSNYYKEFFALLIPFFLSVMLWRMFFLFQIKQQLRFKKVYFNILIIGSSKQANQFIRAFGQSEAGIGFLVKSFLNTNGKIGEDLPESLHVYRDLDNLQTIIQKDQIDEVIITVDKQERNLLIQILQQLSDKDVNIKITPDAVDIMTGAVQTNNVMGVPLIDVHSGLLPSWQKNTKRLIDVALAAIGLILLLPLLLYTAIRTKLSSAGTIFYSQERIGYKGIPFRIYKFRSMHQDAEHNGPQLSADGDPRITKWGRVMRTWRLDELPQLWNIIKGEMSLVGPRPERKFYIDQIVLQHPEYRYLYKVKPGLSSWGMVKYGYASNVEEMIQRMPYDLMYIENASLLLDLRIMLLTLATILKGKGK